MTSEIMQELKPVEQTPQVHKFKFDGEPFQLALIMLKNIILTILTLGVYNFWGRTNTRRFLWQHMALNGDRFEYTGTGKELFVGFLKVIGGYLVIAISIKIISSFVPILQIILSFLFSLFVSVFVIPSAIYLARNYRLTRTRYRGIRFGMANDLMGFVNVWGRGLLFMGLTFGLYYPWFAHNVHKALKERTCIGKDRLVYKGEAGPLVLQYVLLVITLGLYLPWFSANINKYRMNNTYYQDARFNLEVEAFDILFLFIVYIAGMFLTFGLALPFLIVMAMDFWSKRITIHGLIDFDAIAKGDHIGSGTGDELATFIDVDLGF